MATPGLAADEIVPGVEIPGPPVVAASAPVAPPPTDSPEPPTPESSPSAPTATEPPITVSVDAAGGDIDVSVRMLSPSEDAGGTAELPVISDSGVPDITSAAVPDSGLPDDPTGDGPQESNTNVTVRILSPGESGPVGQSTPLEAPEPRNETTAQTAAETETTATAAEKDVPGATSDSAIPTKEGEQYQSADSRYQSSQEFSEDAWIWSWYLSLSCDGNATSSSSETGRQSSRDWKWEWTWEWDCGSPPHPPPVDSLEPALDGDATREAPGPSEKDATASGTVDEAASGDGVAPNQQWLWTWTFTFCGETVTAALPIDTETDLEWVWEWMWTWTCRTETAPSEDAPDPSPAPATGTASGPSANAQGTATPGANASRVEPSFPSVTPVQLPAWVISLLPFPEFGRDSTIGLSPVLDTLTRAGLISTLFEVAPTPIPFVVPAATVDSADAPAAFDTLVTSPRGRQLRERVGTPAATMPVAIGSSLSARAQPHSVGPRVEKASPARRDAAGPRPRGRPLAPWLPPRPFQSAGAPASSSFVPSTSVLGMAALVALFVLAAPGFGRRIRVARELRPRGTYGSSIDRPG